MNNTETDVLGTLDEYAKAFLTLDPMESVPFFNLPMLFISDLGVLGFSDEAHLVGFLTKYMAGLKALSYKRVELSDRTVEVLNDATAVAKFNVVRFGEDDAVLGQLGGTYTFRKDGDDWKIAVGIILAQK